MFVNGVFTYGWASSAAARNGKTASVTLLNVLFLNGKGGSYASRSLRICRELSNAGPGRARTPPRTDSVNRSVRWSCMLKEVLAWMLVSFFKVIGDREESANTLGTDLKRKRKRKRKLRGHSLYIMFGVRLSICLVVLPVLGTLYLT
jgi:hypothetical protein